MLFVLGFVEATGLRAAELLDARVGAISRHKGRLVMKVHGKGSRNRVVAVPGQAEAALRAYLLARHLPELEDLDPEVPVLGSAIDPMEPIGYQALYKTMKVWIAKAIRGSQLSLAEREEALRASPHWLRHTFGTRALERKAPLEVVQRQLGHADPRTTMRYAKAQLERLQVEMDRVFGAGQG
jgi:site-specific recombinase XerD